ncbi:phage tail assembly protein [Rivularia sp. UHCC 0363]|uniref:phage tail assembly protein n=1 Tax=Rivularia sp. UHCC 0363 TaxID=3110244 RepID=UPI002B21A939|nr:phage tail assembly protein [Rivularia sp. UHCC 0363]MEA5598417.1 phage tail assembly protein [Rivularia sp. UHCC 0363]
MSRKETLCTEFSFILPKGLIDNNQRLQRKGLMRLATAKDEIMIQQERKVRENPAYTTLAILSRVISRLGSLNSVTTEQLERLLLPDISYLREFYNRINQQGNTCISTRCPHCEKEFQAQLELAGE